MADAEVWSRAAEVNEQFRSVSVDNGMLTRSAGPAAETVHSFLRFLRAEGLECVPLPLALTGQTETLRFIEGDSGGAGWWHQHEERGLRSAARLLREIHDVSAGWQPPTNAVFGVPAIAGDDAVYCHGDPGPWNFVWRDGEAVALLDWDFLHPAPRIDDVAYALLWFVPFRDDEACLNWHHFPEIPNRRARAAAFLDTYGELPPFDVVDAVVQRRCATIEHVRALAAKGVEPQRTWVAEGTLEAEAAEIRWLECRRADLTGLTSSSGEGGELG